MYNFGDKNDFKEKFNIINSPNFKNSRFFNVEENNSKEIKKVKTISNKMEEKNEIMSNFNEILINSRLGKNCEAILKLEDIYSWIKSNKDLKNKEKKIYSEAKLVFENFDTCLSTVIKEKKYSEEYFDEKELIKITVQLTAGYIYMLERGIVHKDIKPKNIMIKNGNYKFSDFSYSSVNDLVLK